MGSSRFIFLLKLIIWQEPSFAMKIHFDKTQLIHLLILLLHSRKFFKILFTDRRIFLFYVSVYFQQSKKEDFGRNRTTSVCNYCSKRCSSLTLCRKKIYTADFNTENVFAQWDNWTTIANFAGHLETKWRPLKPVNFVFGFQTSNFMVQVKKLYWNNFLSDICQVKTKWPRQIFDKRRRASNHCCFALVTIL